MYGTSKSLWSSTSRTSEVVLSNQNASNLNLHLWKLRWNPKIEGLQTQCDNTIMIHDAFPCCKWTFSVSFSDSRALFGTSPRSSSGVRFMTCTATRASTTSKTTQTYSNQIFWNMACVCIIPISTADWLVRLLMTHLLNHS